MLLWQEELYFVYQSCFYDCYLSILQLVSGLDAFLYSILLNYRRQTEIVIEWIGFDLMKWCLLARYLILTEMIVVSYIDVMQKSIRDKCKLFSDYLRYPPFVTPLTLTLERDRPRNSASSLYRRNSDDFRRWPILILPVMLVQVCLCSHVE